MCFKNINYAITTVRDKDENPAVTLQMTPFSECSAKSIHHRLWHEAIYKKDTSNVSLF